MGWEGRGGEGKGREGGLGGAMVDHLPRPSRHKHTESSRNGSALQVKLLEYGVDHGSEIHALSCAETRVELKAANVMAHLFGRLEAESGANAYGPLSRSLAFRWKNDDDLPRQARDRHEEGLNIDRLLSQGTARRLSRSLHQ